MRKIFTWAAPFAALLCAASPQLKADPSYLDLAPTYSTYLGGSNWERAQGVFVDKDGFIYVGGQTHSSDFPVTPGAYQTEKKGPAGTERDYDRADAFVVKLSPDGSKVLWSTLIGGSNRDQVYTVRTDSKGNVYTVGATGSPDFPTTEGAYDREYGGPITKNGLNDIFLAKFSPDGKLLFSTYIGGAAENTRNEENPRGAIYIDEAHGRIYLAGVTTSPDFPTTPGTVQPAYGGGESDAFVAALSLDGSKLLYATFLGGSRADSGFTDIKPLPDGSLYIGGATNSPDFPVTAKAYQKTLKSGAESEHWWLDGDAFLARISPKLDRLIFSTYFGGNGFDEVSHNQGLGTDSKGRPVVLGNTASSDFPTTEGAFSRSRPEGSEGGFVAIFSADGSKILRSTLIGGSDQENLSGLYVDTEDRVYFTGSTHSPEWPLTPNAFQTGYGNESGHIASDMPPAQKEKKVTISDAVLGVLSPDLGRLLYSTYLGGEGKTSFNGERGRGIWVTGSGAVFLVGTTDSRDFPIMGPAAQKDFGGEGDAFLIRFEPTASTADK